MKTLLQKVFDELKYMDVVKNQSDFGEKMGYTKSYTSTLIKMGANLPNTVQNKLHKTYNISLEFLASGGNGSMFEGKTNKEVQDRLRGMLPDSDVEVSDLSDEIKNSKKSNNSKNISLPSLSTNHEDMDRTLLDIVRMQVENDRQHAKNYAELIDLLRRDIPKEKAS